MISTLPLRIVIRAPFVTRSSDSGDVGIDLPLARTADDRVMIPGSHVIGKLGAALRELRDLLGDDPLAKLFGDDLCCLLAARDRVLSEEEEKESDGREARRALTASDFILQTAAGAPRSRTRIAIDNVRSTVQDGMMQVIEQLFATGQELEFHGTLRVVGPFDAERKQRLVKALQFVTQMGALRSAGYGVIAEITERAPEEHPVSALPPTGTSRVLARLRFEDVFCAGEARNTPNTYKSADHVPGGVIKGAIARQMLASAGRTGFIDDPANSDAFSGDLAALAKNFSALRVLHAQPVPRGNGSRGARSLPDSLATVPDRKNSDVIVDLAGLDDPLQAVLIDGKVPVGSFDWKPKHWAAAGAIAGLGDAPKQVLRVRTQISDERRAAETSRLFGVEYTRGDEHDFLAGFDLTDCSDRDAVMRGLATVLGGGLTGIGRGGAFASVTLETRPAVDQPAAAKRIVAVLQSAALLRDPGNPALDLTKAYGDAFAELGLPESIILKAVFVRERLAGGGFFRKRMADSGSAYVPWLLTEPGATFVFEAADGSDVDPAFLFPNGLDVPPTVLLHHGIGNLESLYRVCPYIRQNGYGELSVNPFRIGDLPLWQVRNPSALGLKVEPVGAFELEGEA